MSMTKVSTQFTMSLDGFIAGPNDDIRRLFGWYSSGDTDLPVAGADIEFKVSRASAEYLQREWSKLGAIVTGRRDFDVSDAWGGKSPIAGARIFIVTHSPPREWVKSGSPFTFVTDGVERALAQARRVAGDRNVAISGSTIVQQCLKAKLLDEILIDLAPILLGAGIRLFDHLGAGPIDLEKISVVDAPDVTHLKFRVVK
jgi:dihydrofolate reductase